MRRKRLDEVSFWLFITHVPLLPVESCLEFPASAGFRLGACRSGTRPEAQKVLEDLDADLARSATKLGKSLSWTAAEREVLKMIANTIDRQVDVACAYEA